MIPTLSLGNVGTQRVLDATACEQLLELRIGRISALFVTNVSPS